MRLYPKREDTKAVMGPAGPIRPADDGGFDLPEPLASLLGSTPDWETAVQRERRKVTAETERKRDPASALDEIAGLRADLAEALSALAKAQAAPEPVKPSRAKAAAAQQPVADAAQD